MSFLAGLLGAGALGAVNTGLDFAKGFAQTQWNRDTSLSLQNNQYELQQKALKESPSAYISGLEQAGLNPMLAYGSPSSPMSSAGSASNAPASAPATSSAKQVKALLMLIKGLKKI